MENAFDKSNLTEDKDNCPYDVDINGQYGTCTCNGDRYEECLGDI